MMTTKMLSPKIEIINHFDELINRVDIDIDECLKNYKEDQVIGDLQFFEIEKRKEISSYSKNKIVKLFDSSKMNKEETVDLWSKSTKVVDYLNQVRMTTIKELKKAQEDRLELYKLNSSHLRETCCIEDLRSKLFAEKFYFQVNISKTNKNPWVFNLYTFVTDFYMSQSDINILE